MVTAAKINFRPSSDGREFALYHGNLATLVLNLIRYRNSLNYYY